MVLPTRFEYWYRHETGAIGWARKGDILAMVGDSTTPLVIDPAKTPFFAITETTEFLLADAYRQTTEQYVVRIWRYDDSDEPYVINKDEYRLRFGLLSSTRLSDICESLPSSERSAAADLLENYVPFEPIGDSTSHWLTETQSPTRVRSELERRKG